jgi:riboflavin synthase
VFTGLIREIAKVKSFENSKLSISAKHKAKLGDSIAINGACLTVVSISSDGFCVELSPESQKLLAMENYRGEVHIEPAMMMGDRFEGHVVQGHVDCIGEIISIEKSGNSTDFRLTIPSSYMKYVIPKGSITVDGVSLTINDVFSDSFRLTIIPHTVDNTIFKGYVIGTKVNIETDMFARYIYNMFKDKTPSWSEVDRQLAIY